jgi:hypothetical protein
VPKFPEPPVADRLARVAPEWHRVPAGTLLFRVYFQGGSHPAPWDAFRHYGPATARFDHHEPPPRVQTRGVLYAATQAITCLAEVFQARRTVAVHQADPWLVGFRLVRAIQLLDLTGRWPTRAGASMAMNSGPRPRAQRWSGSIYAAYPEAEGLWYGSSMHANSPAVALYERAQAAMPAAPVFHRALADPTLEVVLENAALALGYALMARPPG